MCAVHVYKPSNVFSSKITIDEIVPGSPLPGGGEWSTFGLRELLTALRLAL